MSAGRVVVYPVAEGGGRRVRVDGTILGTAYSELDLFELLADVGLEAEEGDLADPAVFEWRGGGRDVWL